MVPFAFASIIAAAIAVNAQHSDPSYLLFIPIILTTLIAAVILRGKRKLISFILAILCAASVEYLLAVHAIDRVEEISKLASDGELALCEGMIDCDPSLKEWGASADVELSSCGGSSVAGKIRLSIPSRGGDLRSGDIIRFSGRLKLPREYKDPGVFSYRKYLVAKGIGATATAKGSVEKIGDGGGSHVFGDGRRAVESAIDGVAGGDRGAILKAISVGGMDEISDTLRDDFSISGLAHLLSISGLHVAYVALFIYHISRLIFGSFPRLIVRYPLKGIAAFVSIPAVWCYVAMSSFQIAAVRSAIMITIYLIATIIWQRQELLNTLALAVVAILAVTPTAVCDVSFQLSASAVAGIILISPPIILWLKGKFGKGGVFSCSILWLATPMAVSFAAMTSTIPIVAYYFNMTSFIGLISNVIAVPFTGLFLMPVIAAAAVAIPISASLAAGIWKLAAIFAGILIQVAELFSRMGASSVIYWSPSSLEIVIFYLALIILLAWRRIPFARVIAVALAIIWFADIAYWRILPLISKDLEMSMIDVGQGESIFIRFPGGRSMIIDGGGIKGSSFDIGRKVVVPTLLAQGVHKIDRALLTHPHFDHYHGLPPVLDLFDVDRLWTNGLAAPDQESGDWDEFISKVKAAGKEIEVVGEDLEFVEEGAKVRIIRPPWKGEGDLNDSSLICDITYGSTRMLLMGDLSSGGEKKMVEMGFGLSANLLKVGHHGSRDGSSQEFLNVIRPEIALISVGAGNRYHLPNAQTLARISDIGAKVYRTDLDGLIRVKSDGKRIMKK